MTTAEYIQRNLSENLDPYIGRPLSEQNLSEVEKTVEDMLIYLKTNRSIDKFKSRVVVGEDGTLNVTVEFSNVAGSPINNIVSLSSSGEGKRSDFDEIVSFIHTGE